MSEYPWPQTVPKLALAPISLAERKTKEQQAQGAKLVGKLAHLRKCIALRDKILLLPGVAVLKARENSLGYDEFINLVDRTINEIDPLADFEALYDMFKNDEMWDDLRQGDMG